MIRADRDFRRYLIGQTLSGFGSALSSVALAFAVLSLSGSASALGLMMAASRVPQIAFALLGGVLGDRYSRRLVLLSTDAVRALLQAITAALLLTHTADLAVLVILQATSGLCSAMFAPAANGLITQVAPTGRNREATALLGISSNTAALAGLAVAGALVGLLGPGLAFTVDAATFTASTVSLALIADRSRLAPLARPDFLADLAAGWRAVRGMPWLLTHCVYVCLLNALSLSPFFVLGPVVAERHLGGAPAWAAIAIAWTVGAIGGGLIARRWRPRQPIAAAVAISAALIAVLGALAVPLPLVLVLPGAALAGVEGSISNTLALVALQDNVPDHLLARASAFESMATLVAAPLGMGFTGLAASWAGTGTVFAFAAVWVLLSSLAALATPAIRGLTQPELRPATQPPL